MSVMSILQNVLNTFVFNILWQITIFAVADDVVWLKIEKYCKNQYCNFLYQGPFNNCYLLFNKALICNNKMLKY